MDVLGEFIESRCTVHENSKVSGGTLYADYRKWADANGEITISQTKFGRAITERGYQKNKDGVVIYHGIGLCDLREVYAHE